MSRAQRFGVGAVVGFSLACSGMDEAMRQAGLTPPAAPAPVEAPAPAEPAAEPAPAAAPAPGGGGNHAACVRYVEKFNALECASLAKQDAAVLCSPALDQMPCDISKYWNCMADAVKCNGPIPDMSGIAACGSPVCG